MTSATIAFDTHEFIKTLETKGFTLEQAEGVVSILKQVFQNIDQRQKDVQLSTDQKLKEIQNKLQEEIKGLKGELATRVDVPAAKTEEFALESRFDSKMTRPPGSRLIKWIVGVAIADVVIILTVLLTVMNMLLQARLSLPVPG